MMAKVRFKENKEEERQRQGHSCVRILSRERNAKPGRGNDSNQQRENVSHLCQALTTTSNMMVCARKLTTSTVMRLFDTKTLSFCSVLTSSIVIGARISLPNSLTLHYCCFFLTFLQQNTPSKTHSNLRLSKAPRSHLLNNCVLLDQCVLCVICACHRKKQNF